MMINDESMALFIIDMHGVEIVCKCHCRQHNTAQLRIEKFVNEKVLGVQFPTHTNKYQKYQKLRDNSSLDSGRFMKNL